MDCEQFQTCMDACDRCAAQCEHWADTWRHEPHTESIADCISLAQDCAEFCRMAVAMMRRESHFTAEICRVGAEICDVCAAQAARHEHAACQQLASECRACAEECRRLTMAVICA